MQLNLPILHLLENSQSILLAGAGGGFDVYGALPLYFTLKAMGKNVHLGSYSFSDVMLIQRTSQPEVLHDKLLVGTGGTVKPRLAYLPESYLSEWFEQATGVSVPIWTFQKVGAGLLKRLYETLIEKLSIDAIILVDGGVDSLMRGNEEGCGTLLDDTISLTAIRELPVPVKVLACVGFGAELEVNHANALRNMAELVKQGAFYGSCALTPQMEVYKRYEEACLYVFDQPGHSKSRIQSHIMSAVEGQFGNFHRYADGSHYVSVFVSALMSLYWFFDADAVSERSLIAPLIRDDEDFYDSWEKAHEYLKKHQNVKRQTLPY
jgi:hypothetical protein